MKWVVYLTTLIKRLRQNNVSNVVLDKHFIKIVIQIDGNAK